MNDMLIGAGHYRDGDNRGYTDVISDPGKYRPWREFGRSWRERMLRDNWNNPILNADGQPKTEVELANVEATLTRDQWIFFDDEIMKTERPELALFDEIAAVKTVTIPQGIAKSVFEYRIAGDAGSATTSFDAIRESNRDRPTTDTDQIPIPIYHGEFSFSERELMIAAGSQMPLDSFMGEQIRRKIDELKEQTAIGTYVPTPYAGKTIRGITTFAGRNTMSLTPPTGLGWTPDDTVNDVIAMRSILEDDNYDGPYTLYVGTDWNDYMDLDFSAVKGENTLRQRILAIGKGGDGGNIRKIKRLRFLTGTQMILVDGRNKTMQIIKAMDYRLVQWSERGGMLNRWMLMWAGVPLFRADAAGNCGIVHGS